MLKVLRKLRAERTFDLVETDGAIIYINPKRLFGVYEKVFFFPKTMFR